MMGLHSRFGARCLALATVAALAVFAWAPPVRACQSAYPRQTGQPPDVSHVNPALQVLPEQHGPPDKPQGVQLELPQP
jgi:hypothetical protein